MKVAFRAALAVAGVLAAGQASATVSIQTGINANDYAESYMTYRTIDEVRTSLTDRYSGVGTLFVSYLSTATTGFGSVCTGALIGSGTVLTAAHCLQNNPNGDNIASIRFFLPSFGDRNQPGAKIFDATGFANHPDYAQTGLVGGNDIAAFTITGDTSGHDIYGLYSGDPLKEFEVVGTGTIGGPAGTGTGGVGRDNLKRVGRNIFEYYGNEVFVDSSAGVVLYDFDDGSDQYDVFGRAGGFKQTGIDGESSSSPGDSGGPSFIDGRIAAVTSFGITGAVFQPGGYCGADSIDPFAAGGSTARTPINSGRCTNSSIGEIGGNTLVSYNIDFVNGYLNGTVRQTGFVPEPATWIMMILGFGAIGGSMRSRRRQTKVAYSMA